MELQPLLKWAGGKRWFVHKAAHLLPKDFNRYIEPFLGGGAIYFHLKPETAILSDVNAELINVYSAIKEDWEKVAAHLELHQKLHCKEHYYKVRSQAHDCVYAMAARTLYLNRTCWNGLYRVNLRGEFNVPIGTKSKVTDDLHSFPKIAELFRKANFSVCDFEKTLDQALDGDFVFVDPPYTVKHNENGFIKYNETLFRWEDQIRLRDAVARAVARGAKVLVLNANHESIVKLYDGFQQTVLSRSNVLAGKSEFRGVYQELAVRCWED